VIGSVELACHLFRSPEAQIWTIFQTFPYLAKRSKRERERESARREKRETTHQEGDFCRRQKRRQRFIVDILPEVWQERERIRSALSSVVQSILEVL